MARPGLFDPVLRSKASFDPSLLVEGWYDPDFLGAGIVAPPAPPPVVYGGGYFPAIVKPQAHLHVGVVFLGRLRVGSRVVYFRNLAIEEEDDIIALL